MPFDSAPSWETKQQTTAVIGSGISGLSTAYLLSRNHKVTLFEAENRLGGHARTILGGPNRDIPVDTGFMVFNYRTYPHLTALFDQLGVPVKKTNMSFGLSLDHGKFEYGLHQPRRLLADPTNLIKPHFWRMLADILRFNRSAHQYLDDPNLTLGDLLKTLGMSNSFRDLYLFPFAGAIWSTQRHDMLQFPAQSLLRFFDNHGLLSSSDNPQWWTVDGGSREYVSRIEKQLHKSGCEIRLNAPVKAVKRAPEPVVYVEGGPAEPFDNVVFACHSDQALKMLADPSADETDILSALRYRSNKAYLHADTSQMPVRRAAWSSWVYRGNRAFDADDGSFTYWMNLLQSIPNDTPLFVTLNPYTPIDERLIYDEHEFAHPQFDLAAKQAQSKLRDIQGKQNTFYAGAYTRHGFHEDGIHSAVQVARVLGETPQWV